MRTPAIDAADRRIRAPGTGEPARAIGGSDGRVIGTSAAPRGTSSIADDPPRGKTPHEWNGAPAHGHRPPDRVPPRRPRGTPWREHRAGTPSHTAARSRAARCHGHHDTGAGVLPTVPGAAGGVVPWNLMNILATDHIPSADPPMPRAPVRPAPPRNSDDEEHGRGGGQRRQHRHDERAAGVTRAAVPRLSIVRPRTRTPWFGGFHGDHPSLSARTGGPCPSTPGPRSKPEYGPGKESVHRPGPVRHWRILPTAGRCPSVSAPWRWESRPSPVADSRA